MCQQSHRSDPRILNRRTLRRDHRYLASVLRTGMDILDVGCGTGAITADIATAVGPDGRVLGIDRDDANLAGAVQQYGGMKNLRFETVDIVTPGDRFNSSFDIVTAARTIQWISEPQRAIGNMKKAVKPGGRVIVLDYNLDETRWEPDPPVDFLRFYQAFLDWRNGNRLDNQMASHLTALFYSEGLVEVARHASDELVRRGDPDFFDAYASGIWLYVIQTLGPKLVQEGFLEESVRLRAEADYGVYVRDALQLQRHSMSTVEGWVAC
jgi:SAM-dependent methyltransferase